MFIKYVLLFHDTHIYTSFINVAYNDRNLNCEVGNLFRDQWCWLSAWLLELSQRQREEIQLGNMGMEEFAKNFKELYSLLPTWQVTKRMSWLLKLWPYGSGNWWHTGNKHVPIRPWLKETAWVDLRNIVMKSKITYRMIYI